MRLSRHLKFTSSTNHSVGGLGEIINRIVSVELLCIYSRIFYSDTCTQMIWIGSKFFKTIITSDRTYIFIYFLKLKNENCKLLTSILRRDRDSPCHHNWPLSLLLVSTLGSYFSGSPKALLRRQIHQLISSARFMETILFPSLNICLVNFSELRVLKTFTCLLKRFTRVKRLALIYMMMVSLPVCIVWKWNIF